mmetsp:Transcript_45806/g.85496  ORF Transcript_45806/g.85496 Transcript_45806/m.85496 type:complete len:181 (+) Transcript_45806:31-573(+)
MARKKVRVTRENNFKRIVQDEEAQEKKQELRNARRKQLKETLKNDMKEKLEKVRAELEGEAGDPEAGAKGTAMEVDGGTRKMKVIKTISKLKKQKQTAKQAKVDRKLLRAAKERGVIRSIQAAKRTLEGKQKDFYRPDGRERRRDKRVRVAREKRERRGLSKPKYAEDEFDEGEEEEEET